MKVGYSMNVMYITLVFKGCLWTLAENVEWQNCDGRLYHFSTSKMTYSASMTQCFYVIKVSHMNNLSRTSLASENRIGKACRQLTIPNGEYYWIESLSSTAGQPTGQCKKMQKIGERCYFTSVSCTSLAHPFCETIKIATATSPHPLQANPMLRFAMTSSRHTAECSDSTYVVPVERAMYYSESKQFCRNNYESVQIEFGASDEAFISKYLQNCIGKLQEKLPYWVGICKTIHLEGASIKKEKVDACFEADEKNRAFPICKLRNNLNQWLRTDVTNPTIPTETATVKTLIGAGNVSTQKSLYNRWFYKTPFHQFYLSNHNADFDSCISFCASMEGSRLAINPLGLLQNTLDKHDHYWANDNAASFTDIANRKCSLLISCPEESPGCSNLRFKNFSVTCSTEAHCICERIDVRFTKPVTSATTQISTASTSTTHTTTTYSATQTTTSSTSTTPITKTTSTTPTKTTTTSTSSTTTSTVTSSTPTTTTSTTHTTTSTTSTIPTTTVTSTTTTRTTASTITSTTTSTPETITATSTVKQAAKFTTAGTRPVVTGEVNTRSAISNATRRVKSSSTSTAGTEEITPLKEATTTSAAVASAEATTNATPISHERLSEKHIIGQQEYFICYREQNYSESRENCNRAFNGSLAFFPGSLMYFSVMEQLNLKNGSFWIGVPDTNINTTSGCLTFDKSDKTMSTTSCESKQFSVCSRLIYTHEDLQREVLENAAFKEILKDMTVNRKDTTLSKRKVSSAEDKRQSSRTLGAVSAFVLCSLVSVVVLIDLPRLRNLFIA